MDVPSQRRSTGECPYPAIATLPRCSQTPRPSLSLRHRYRFCVVIVHHFSSIMTTKSPPLGWTTAPLATRESVGPARPPQTPPRQRLLPVPRPLESPASW